jgi:hypothetical protein
MRQMVSRKCAIALFILFTGVKTVSADDDAPRWHVHRCQRSVLPPGYAAPDPEFSPRNNGEDPSDPMGVGGDYTRDDKLAALNRKRASAGVCDTRNRTKLAESLLRLAPPPPTSSPRASAAAGYEYAPLVRGALALSPEEEIALATNGVVVPERLTYANYTEAYYDVHRAQLPVYVSVDSILHAVYASHDQFVAKLERDETQKRLDALLGAMHCGLASAAKQYPAEVANDVDLYLTVARSLLAGKMVLSELGKVDERAEQIVDQVVNPTAIEVIDLFGRARALDTTAFTPRGHYADFRLEDYFRAATWLSRVDLNLVSRDTRASQPGYTPDATETPREAVVALALADLAQRTRSLDDIAELDRSWRTLAGKREDVSYADLVALRKKAKIGKLSAASAAALRAAIGNDFVRTVNTGPTPNVERLPVIATMLGPRITPDTVAIGGLIDQRGSTTSGVELAYMLGVDRAKQYIAKDPHVDSLLAAARTSIASLNPTEDLYSGWLAAIRALAIKPVGTTPSFMDGAAYQDLRLNTVIAAYGQLRHNHVLIEAEAYDQGGCEIPDGYVEPALATYEALADFAKRGAKAIRELDPRDRTDGIAYFKRLEKLMRVLATISREELANKPLSVETKRFLAMIVERRVARANTYNASIPLATFDGWYPDLFPNIDTALESPSFVADWATYDRNGQTGVQYLGAKSPRLGIFVVDTGGKARLMVGPVAQAFQYRGELATRLTDADAQALVADAPWAKSYTVASPVLPAFDVAFDRGDPQRGRLGDFRSQDQVQPNIVRIDSKRAHGDVTIELLDHHFVPMDQLSVSIANGRTEVPVPSTPRPIEALRVRFGKATQRLDVPLTGVGWWHVGL